MGGANFEGVAWVVHWLISRRGLLIKRKFYSFPPPECTPLPKYFSILKWENKFYVWIIKSKQMQQNQSKKTYNIRKKKPFPLGYSPFFKMHFKWQNIFFLTTILLYTKNFFFECSFWIFFAFFYLNNFKVKNLAHKSLCFSFHFEYILFVFLCFWLPFTLFFLNTVFCMISVFSYRRGFSFQVSMSR